MEAGRNTIAGLLERDAELAAIEGLLERASGGDGAFVAVEAQAGLGKTALLEQSCELASDRGMLALRARGSELELEFPLGIVRQLFEPQVFADSREGREALFSGAAALAEPLLTGGWAPPGESPDDPALPLLHGLYWLVANLSQRQPLVICVDDLHWSDEASLRFLLFLLRRLHSLPISVLAASRGDETVQPTGSLFRLLSDPGVCVLRLPPLSARATASLLRASVGEPEPEFVEAAHEATGGNPFFLNELVRALAERGVPPVRERRDEIAAVGPASVAQAVWRRLDRLPRAAADLARAVAVLGDDAEVRLAARWAGVDEHQAAVAAGLLVRAAVLADERPLRFLHPIVRSAVYDELTESERAAAHGTAARLLAAEGAAERAAVHHLLSEPSGDPQVVELLLRAGERAIARGAPELAARYLRRGLHEPPASGRRAPVLVALGRAELAATEPEAAETHLREALELAPGPRDRVEVAIALAQALVQGRSFDEGATLLDRERIEIAERDEELALQLEAEFAGLAWVNRANVPPPERIEQYALLAGRTQVERKLLAAVANLWMASGRPASACVPLATRALAAGRVLGREGLGIPQWLAACGVVMAGEDAETTDQAIAAGLEDAREHVAPLEFFILTGVSSAWAYVRGDLRNAEAAARIALDVGREHGFAARLPAERWLLNVLVETGRLEEAAQLLDESGHDGDLPGGLLFDGVRESRASLRMAQGCIDEAVSDLSASLEGAAALGGEGRPELRAKLAMALRGSDPSRAHALAAAALAAARRWGAPGSIGIALRALALVTSGEEGLRQLHEAAATLAGSERRLEHARTLVELGAALRRAGERREARTRLQEGADIAQRCGADALVERALEELKATGARPRKLVFSGVDSLTPMERRIAELAAQGLKNAEIAQALFVTVKNVEMHLTRAYRKLDISSRTELPGVLAESP